MKRKIAVIGAGSWGTAIALVLAGKNYDVSLWVYDVSEIPEMVKSRENKLFLPGYILPENISITHDYQEAVKDTKDICMVVPSHGFRKVFEGFIDYIQTGSNIISAVKGIENESLMTMTQVIEEIRTKRQSEKKFNIAVLSGPSFAKEVADGIPTAITLGCKDVSIAKYLQDLFFTEKFRVYARTDVIGLEISAALKNIIAIAAGVCDGLGYGSNTRAALITRGLVEITRIGIKLGGESSTFSGLGGLGDLVLTCTGELSRNRTVGLKLGQGKKMDDILGEMQMVAEGVKTAKSCHNLALKLGVEMPILDQVYKIIYEDKDCDLAVSDLLSRESKME
ncbi:MAG: NAD(P)-dependent glycerol-3-phosphate dehydrogenase [Bacteroidetes bacterium]|nr:NAD(P)-dependent glycerol-3-phosphate dehydrogenase [Bacteroidota bacterium]